MIKVESPFLDTSLFGQICRLNRSTSKLKKYEYMCVIIKIEDNLLSETVCAFCVVPFDEEPKLRY